MSTTLRHSGCTDRLRSNRRSCPRIHLGQKRILTAGGLVIDAPHPGHVRGALLHQVPVADLESRLGSGYSWLERDSRASVRRARAGTNMLRFLIGFSIGLTLLAALVGYQPPRQALDPPAIQRVVP